MRRGRGCLRRSSLCRLCLGRGAAGGGDGGADGGGGGGRGDFDVVADRPDGKAIKTSQMSSVKYLLHIDIVTF